MYFDSGGVIQLEEIRRMFQYDGREHNLTLKRDGQTIKVKLKLRRLI
jgi:hypothetical protein